MTFVIAKAALTIIAAPLDLVGDTIVDVSAGATLTVSGITGAGKLIKTGPGTLVIDCADNTYSSGTLVFENSTPSAPTNPINLADGAALSNYLYSQLTLSTANVTFPTLGEIIFNDDRQASSITINGSYPTLTGDLTVQVGNDNSSSPNTVTFVAPISGGHYCLAKAAISTLDLDGENTLGSTTLLGGTIGFVSGGLGTSGPITIDPGAGNTASLAFINSSNTQRNDLLGRTITINSGTAAFDLQGSTVTVNTAISGSGGLSVKDSVGGGTMILGAQNTSLPCRQTRRGSPGSPREPKERVVIGVVVPVVAGVGAADIESQGSAREPAQAEYVDDLDRQHVLLP